RTFAPRTLESAFYALAPRAFAKAAGTTFAPRTFRGAEPRSSVEGFRLRDALNGRPACLLL
ncbi:MAG TPA: hypothetical protein DFS52_12975, partial [Myxococcales bacterium]|nr:hypothetical protein [Myxococcales bacterium]